MLEVLMGCGHNGLVHPSIEIYEIVSLTFHNRLNFEKFVSV